MNMVLPIVLLLASAGPMQQADHAKGASAEQPSKPQIISPLTNPEPNRFVHRFPGAGEALDKGILPTNLPCDAQHECEQVCAKIMAFVFSDGETPELKYVTDCPNRDVPPQTERANGKRPRRDQPSLKRTN